MALGSFGFAAPVQSRLPSIAQWAQSTALRPAAANFTGQPQPAAQQQNGQAALNRVMDIVHRMQAPGQVVNPPNPATVYNPGPAQTVPQFGPQPGEAIQTAPTSLGGSAGSFTPNPVTSSLGSLQTQAIDPGALSASGVGAAGGTGGSMFSDLLASIFA